MRVAMTQQQEDDIVFKTATHKDQEVLWEMLMHAAHENTDIRESPILSPYAHDFGKRPNDLGLIATIQNQVVGAAWIRLLGKQGFGFVENDIPELAMAVLPNYRGQGVGSRLLQTLLKSAQQVVRGVSLGCRSDNTAALRLYEKMGFVKVPNSEVTNRVGGISFTMVCIF